MKNGARGTAWLSGLALPIGVASCTLLVDTSGLSTSDTSVEAGVDGAPAIEGGIDSSAPLDGATDPCADPTVVLCERFNDEASISRYPAVTDPTTTISLDKISFFSPPGSAKFLITPSTNTSPDTTLALKTDVSLARFAVEARVRIDRNEPGQGAQLLNLTTGPRILVVDHSGEIRDGATLIATVPSPPSNEWVRLRVEVRTDTPTKSVVVTLGSTTTDTLPISANWAAGPVQVQLGVSEANSPTTGWLVRWDDVILQRL